MPVEHDELIIKYASESAAPCWHRDDSDCCASGHKDLESCFHIFQAGLIPLTLFESHISCVDRQNYPLLSIQIEHGSNPTFCCIHFCQRCCHWYRTCSCSAGAPTQRHDSGLSSKKSWTWECVSVIVYVRNDSSLMLTASADFWRTSVDVKDADKPIVDHPGSVIDNRMFPSWVNI